MSTIIMELFKILTSFFARDNLNTLLTLSLYLTKLILKWYKGIDRCGSFKKIYDRMSTIIMELFKILTSFFARDNLNTLLTLSLYLTKLILKWYKGIDRCGSFKTIY